MPEIERYFGGIVKRVTETPQERRERVNGAREGELAALRRIAELLAQPSSREEKDRTIVDYIGASRRYIEAQISGSRKEVLVFGRRI